MRLARIALCLCGAMAILSIGPGPASGGSGNGVSSGPVDLDPLRKYLPRADIYMPIPGGRLAVVNGGGPHATYEEQVERRDGGMVIGYCLRASCSYVTHIVVIQVCGNRVGGPGGGDQLVLGIVRLPFGSHPGYVWSLQGRDYATNFSDFGPHVQTLVESEAGDAPSLFALSAQGMGPVAALEYLGSAVKATQSRDTIALQLIMARDAQLGVQGSRFEIRHLCQKPMS
jgi:hypothetical protein